MLLIITSTGDKLLRNVNNDDLEWPWTPKILILSDFFGNSWLQKSELRWCGWRQAKITCIQELSWAPARLMSISSDFLFCTLWVKITYFENFLCVLCLRKFQFNFCAIQCKCVTGHRLVNSPAECSLLLMVLQKLVIWFSWRVSTDVEIRSDGWWQAISHISWLWLASDINVLFWCCTTVVFKGG